MNPNFYSAFKVGIWSNPVKYCFISLWLSLYYVLLAKAHKWDLGVSHRVTLDVVIMKECERAEMSGLSTLGRDPVLALPLLSVFNTFSLFVIHSCRTRKHTPTPERGQI